MFGRRRDRGHRCNLALFFFFFFLTLSSISAQCQDGFGVCVSMGVHESF